jgi:hypothetical protein
VNGAKTAQHSATLLLAALLLAACRTQAPTARPDQAAQLLDQLQDLDASYGLAPLLLDDDTRVLVQDGVAYLDYPDQPAAPGDWPAIECFITAYAVRDQLLDNERVRDATLGRVTLDSGLQGGGNRYHFVTQVTLADGSTTTIDLTPLAADQVGPRYDPDGLTRDAAQLDDQFQSMRQGVSLDKVRAMLTARRDGQLYYLLVSVLVLENEYQFTLYGHQMQPATRDRSLQITRSAILALRITRADLREVQTTLIKEGPGALAARSHWLTRQGDTHPALSTVLNEHLYLLWHLITKFDEPGAIARTIIDGGET